MLTGLLCGEKGKGWSVLLLAREKAKKIVCSLSCWLACLLQASGEARRAREMVKNYVAWRGDPGKWHQLFSLDEICKFETPTAKTIPALNNDLKLSSSGLRASTISPRGFYSFFFLFFFSYDIFLYCVAT